MTRFPSTCSLDVVGIGNAIVDVLVQTDDTFLTQHGLQKGGMALIDEQQAETLYIASGPGLETSGVRGQHYGGNCPAGGPGRVHRTGAR